MEIITASREEFDFGTGKWNLIAGSQPASEDLSGNNKFSCFLEKWFIFVCKASVYILSCIRLTIKPYDRTPE
jgi:hypothetical protein